jgi:hypothetical protein
VLPGDGFLAAELGGEFPTLLDAFDFVLPTHGQASLLRVLWLWARVRMPI